MEAPAWATQPQLISLNPSSGSGQSQTFALTVSDPAGAADIGSMNLLINSSLDGSSGCWIYFDHPNARFTLYSNGNWTGPASTGGTLSGSLCSVQLDALGLDHFGPLFGLLGDVFCESSRAQRHRLDAQLGESSRHIGIG